MVERVDFSDGDAMMVLKPHIELMCEDGYVFKHILNGHPSMKKERSPLDVSRYEFSMLLGVIRRGDLPSGDRREVITHLNDKLGGFRSVDKLLVSPSPLTPDMDIYNQFDWEFIRFGYIPDYEREIDLRKEGYVFASLKDHDGPSKQGGLFLKKPVA